MQRGRERVVIVDPVGPRRYMTAEGRPFLDPMQYAVHMVTTNPDARAAHPHFEELLISKPEKLWFQVRETVSKTSPQHLVCLAERYLLEAGRVRDEFDLSGPGHDEVAPFRDKVAMKQVAAEAGIPCAEIQPATQEHAAELLRKHGRVVVKPRFGLGSVDIRIFEDAQSLGDALKVHPSAATDLVVEEWIAGTIVHVDSLIVEGEIAAATVGHILDPTTTFASHGDVLRDIALPDSDPIARRAHHANQQVIAAFAPANGVTHHEMFCDSTGRLTFCEIAWRPGGIGIVHGFKHRTGLDLYEMATRAQVSAPLPRNVVVSPDLTGILLIYAGPGRLTSPPVLPASGNLLVLDVFDPPTGLLPAPADISQALVQAVYRGKTSESLNQEISKAATSCLSTLLVT